jgi:hypothetical protein
MLSIRRLEESSRKAFNSLAGVTAVTKSTAGNVVGFENGF